nr:hypothetical protein [Tanacetum cinerariifolium]
MSDSNESGVTYIDISSPFEELSNIRSPRADDHEHLELLEMLEDPYVEVALQAPPSPDYIPGPEEPEQAPPSPDYVLGPEHADDEIVAEDQPYAEDASPIAQSPEYVLESDLEAHPEDDDDEDPEEDHADKEEEEHPSPADSIVVASTAADQAPSAKETEPFETDESAATPPPHPVYRMTTRISIPAPSSPPAQIPFPPLPPILSPPSPVLSPAPPHSPIRSLGYRAAMIQLRAEAASTSSPPLQPPSASRREDRPEVTLPPQKRLGIALGPIYEAASTSSPPLQPPSASRREDRPEVTLPPQKRLGIALGPIYEVGESLSAAAARPAGGLRADYGFVATMDREIMPDPEREVGYRITDSWDEIVETLQGAPVSTDTKLGGYIREFETRVRQDTYEIYMRLDDEQTEPQLLAGRLNMLFRDRRAHTYTCHLMETEARMSREAWVRSTDASDLVRGEVMSLRTTVLGQMTEIRELHAADRRRQTVISELLRTYHRRSTEITELRTALQGQVTALQGQVTALQAHVTALQGQQGLAGGPTQQELPEEAVTNAQLQAMIDQGVTTALAVRDALRSTNGDDSHNFGTGAPKELPVIPNGVKEWSPSFISATAQLKIKSKFDKIEKYIGGLPDMIHGSVVASKPKTMQEAIEIATELMDKRIRTFAERETVSKRKFENTSRNTQNQQQQSNKRQNTGRVYTAASDEKKQYGGSKPLCAKCSGRNNASARVYAVGHAGTDPDANVMTGIADYQMCYGVYLDNQHDPHLQMLLEQSKNPLDTIDPD